METKEMKALNCLLSIIDCYMKEDEKYGIFPEDTIKKDVEEAKTILETFINNNLTVREKAVIACLKDHLIDYIPESLSKQIAVDKAINQVIGNYRMEKFYELLLDDRLNLK